MILADTSVWIDFFNGNPSRETRLLRGLIGTKVLMTGDIVMCEVLQGFRHEQEHKRAMDAMDNLRFVPMVGRDVAFASAQNYRYLRRKGVTIRTTIDMIIATFCIENAHTLLHCDRDFEAIAEHLPLVTL